MQLWCVFAFGEECSGSSCPRPHRAGGMRGFANLLSLLTAIALSTPNGRLVGQTVTFARIQTNNSIEILDLESRTWRKVYRSPTWITELSVGPSSDRLAFLAWREGVIEGHDYVIPPASELIVIDTTGKVLALRVANVQRYAWCGSSCILYITGEYEESHYNFRPQGIGILDIKTGKTRDLPSPSTPIGITWAAFDSAAYIKNLPPPGEAFIYRLDLAALTLEPTRLKDHVFSPTGRYYLYDGEFTDTLVVYETGTNQPVDLESFRRGALLIGWASAREDVLLAVRRPPPRPRPVGRPRLRVKRPGEDEKEAMYKLYDLSTRRVRQTMMGYLGRWVGPPYAHLLGHAGGYEAAGVGLTAEAGAAGDR